MRPKIYTSRYNNRKLKDFDGVKVQISMRLPEWYLGYVPERIKLLEPRGVEWDENFEANYRKQLEKIGVEAIEREFQRLWSEYPDKPIILLCFENVYEKDCHRRMFARWWQENTGETIEELEKPPVPKPDPRKDQLQLL